MAINLSVEYPKLERKCMKLRYQNLELINALKNAQQQTMYLIDMTETGVRRNLLCDMNINLSIALQKVTDEK